MMEALAERMPDGRWIIRAPRVGVYRGAPHEGGRRGGGDVVGRLQVLNRTEDLALPAGVEGLVTGIEVHERAVAVEYGQILFVLSAAGQPAEPPPDRRGPATAEPAASPAAGCFPVASPIDGVFYRRPAPGAAPYVTPGSVIETGRTVGLIEAMKSFNAVTYGGPGLPPRAIVVETPAGDATEVRQGATLLIVKPA